MSDDDLIAVPTPPGVGAVFTTRRGGISAAPFNSCNLGRVAGEFDGALRENRRRVCARLGLDPEVVAMGTQVHGTLIREVTEPTDVGRFLGELSGWPTGDGLTTGVMGLPLGVLVADCMPVLMWRLDGSRVAAVHAGWRGLVDGILARAVEQLGDGAIGVAIGPCAGPCCYQVDAGLRDRFTERFGSDTVVADRVDLPAAAAAELARAGVRPEHVHTDGSCTICHPDRFFSYRRDGAETGRQSGMIWRCPA